MGSACAVIKKTSSKEMASGDDVSKPPAASFVSRMVPVSREERETVIWSWRSITDADRSLLACRWLTDICRRSTSISNAFRIAVPPHAITVAMLSADPRLHRHCAGMATFLTQLVDLLAGGPQNDATLLFLAKKVANAHSHSSGNAFGSEQFRLFTGAMSDHIAASAVKKGDSSSQKAEHQREIQSAWMSLLSCIARTMRKSLYHSVRRSSKLSLMSYAGSSEGMVGPMETT